MVRQSAVLGLEFAFDKKFRYDFHFVLKIVGLENSASRIF